MKSGIITFFIIVGLYLANSSFFILTEGKQALITQFGRPIGKSIDHAGVHFKIPFVQDVRYVDKRILSWDGNPDLVTTKDKKYIQVDTTARWRIVDALKFIATLRNEEQAISKLETILDGITKNVISSHRLVETVRNSNKILEELAERKKGEFKDEVTGEIEKVTVGRENLSQLIVQQAQKDVAQYGITIIDVQLKRISYEKSVEIKVYERMISERKRIASNIRSVGKGEQARIEGRLSKDLQQITSEAYKQAQIIKGEAEARAIKIYADSLGEDPGFYEFMKSMEVYKKAFKPETQFILSSDSEFLKYFKRAN